MSELRIRQPLSAGTWYRNDASSLRREIQGYLDQAPPKPDSGDLIGLVAPHAGHRYSGHVAGAGFAWLNPGDFETIILIGPDHFGLALGQIASLDVDTWRTPLGDIPVAWNFLQSIQTDIDLIMRSTSDENQLPRYEHSLEVELPFLQMTLKEFNIVPLIMGDPSPSTCSQLAGALVKAISSHQFGPTLLVASSDMSHFFDDDTARRLDQASIQFMLDLDSDGLTRHAQNCNQSESPCGTGPITTVIRAAKALGATKAHLVKYATSADADISSGRQQVVGYAAVAFSK